jgi:hypothetical protein
VGICCQFRAGQIVISGEQGALNLAIEQARVRGAKNAHSIDS